MSTIEIENTRPRSLAALCRRRDELRATGVRPETLSWAVAEASEPALSVLRLEGPEMVRTYLEEARDPGRSGPEAEALMVFAAAGVNKLRREARALGVGISLNRYEAIREVRRTRKPEPAEAFEAVRATGALRLMEMMCDRTVSFHRALAEEIAAASEAGRAERVKALCQVGAFGIWGLRRGVRIDVDDELVGCDLDALTAILAEERPRIRLRAEAQAASGEDAERLALLSFVQTGWLGRAVRKAKRERSGPIAEALRVARGSADGGREVAAVRGVGEHDAPPARQTGLDGR